VFSRVVYGFALMDPDIFEMAWPGTKALVSFAIKAPLNKEKD